MPLRRPAPAGWQKQRDRRVEQRERSVGQSRHSQCHTEGGWRVGRTLASCVWRFSSCAFLRCCLLSSPIFFIRSVRSLRLSSCSARSPSNSVRLAYCGSWGGGGKRGVGVGVRTQQYVTASPNLDRPCVSPKATDREAVHLCTDLVRLGLPEVVMFLQSLAALHRWPEVREQGKWREAGRGRWMKTQLVFYPDGSAPHQPRQENTRFVGSAPFPARGSAPKGTAP